MKKYFVKLLAVLMVIIAVLSACSVAFAGEENDEPGDRYSVIGVVSGSLTIRGLTATCTGRVSAQYSTTLKITLELQKKKSGTYTTIKTWTSSTTSTSHLLQGQRTINPLSTYRLKATFKAGSESTTKYIYPS